MRQRPKKLKFKFTGWVPTISPNAGIYGAEIGVLHRSHL